MAFVIDQPQPVAGKFPPRSAIADIAGMVGQEDVQHLGRADTVEYGNPHAGFPAAPDILGQAFTGGNAEPEPRGAVFGRAIGIGQHGGVKRRHAEEKRRVEPVENVEDRGRCRAVGQEHGGGAHRHRDRHAGAEAIGKEELGGAEADILMSDAQHVLAVIVGHVGRAGMDVAHPLGSAGRTRGIEPEGGFIGVGVGGIEAVIGCGHQRVEPGVVFGVAPLLPPT